MGIIGGTLGYQLLRYLTRPEHQPDKQPSSYTGATKVERLFGSEFWAEIQGLTVIDYGCGVGTEAIELARRGAKRVIGVDLNEAALDVARQQAERDAVGRLCEFTTQTNERANVIISLDAFEHFADVPDVLNIMYGLLEPGGKVIASFGPTWYHPLGGHLFSVVPWAHLIFTEESLLRWRTTVRDGRPRSFREAGLNMMTIKGFEQIVEQSPLQLSEFTAVPIRRLSFLTNRWTREWTTSVVRCTLIPRSKSCKF